MSTGESKKESPKVKHYFPEEYTCGWCPASTRRLLLKLAQHKPAGLAKHFHLMCLVDLLNHIYEDETDIIFEEYLDEENLNELKRRRAQSSLTRTELMKFPPLYKIRPTAKQIQDKLEELYGIEIVENNELIPDELSVDVDFELPDYVLEMPDPDLESAPPTPSPQPSLPVTPIIEKPGPTRKLQKVDSKPGSSTASATGATTSRRGSSRVSATQSQTASQPTRAIVKRLSTAERKVAVNSDAELFSPPAPQRATRAAAAAAAASVSSTSASKRRGGASAATASPSPSPRSSRSSTPASAKRER